MIIGKLEIIEGLLSINMLEKFLLTFVNSMKRMENVCLAKKASLYKKTLGKI